MKIRTIASAVGLASLVLPGTAQANWRFTQWGNSVDQVVKAGKAAQVEAIADRDGDRVGELQRLAVGEVSEGGINVQVQFYFTPDGKSLELIRYEPVEKTACVDVEAITVKLYGPGKLHDDVEPMDDSKGGTFNVTFHMRDWSGPGGDKVGFMHALIAGQPTNVCTWTFEPAA